MRVYPIVLIVMLAVSACSQQGEQDADAAVRSTANQQVSVMRNHNTAQIQHGRELFAQYCATCHGSNAEGAANWTRPDANGHYPPPPLNGTGHAWHHPKRALISTIKHGTVRLGGSMPAWQETLNVQDIDDIITWFQSLWPDEIYAAWRQRDQAARLGTR